MHAFVTLVSSDSYLPGALTQVAALVDLHEDPYTVCLVTPESLDVSTIKSLRKAFNLVVGVEILEQDNKHGLHLLGRPDLTTVLTKLHVFRLTQFSKIIFLDADVLPIRPIDHLFSLPHEFSAVPDVGWPDIFNSGVMVLTPGEDKFAQLNQLLNTSPSWDGGDQGILNEWRGGDWNRLSFIYNTTPTAAYTYAPAYERYGSQISAIHFIGPNKPWNSIAYRPPFSPSRPSEDHDPQRAYDYQSLVDRWYNVYDHHYRIHSLPSQDQFEIKRYTSVWDAPPAESTPVNVHSLDDLKRLAIQGHNASAVPSSTLPGEGEYKTLPLEGRFDLMRPREQKPKEEPKEEVKQEIPASTPAIHLESSDKSPSDYFAREPAAPFTPLSRHIHLADDVNRWHTLPTPGPEECPASPCLHIVSLPAIPSPNGDSVHFHPEQNQKHHEAPQHHRQQHYQQDSPQSPHQSHIVQEHKQHHERPRPSSPPLLSWNPAIEPPPNTTPTPNAFPVNTYFANIWDHTPSRHNDQSHTSPTTLPDSSGFFKPLPAPEIPESLIKQGHYRNVTGDSYLGATPSPDRSRVKSVFPWEEKPRVMPARVFPDSDAPPPSLFLSPSSQSQTSTTTAPSTPETKGSSIGQPRTTQLSPLYGLPTSFNYANAWDNIPSIQKYASRLVRVPPPPPMLAPAFEDSSYRKGRRKSWDERVEISSRDGDDEDNADDEDDDEPTAAAKTAEDKWDDNDIDRETSRRRSRSNSLMSAATRHKGKKKEYKQRGVQTMTVETRSQGVQVDPPPKPETRRQSSRRSSASSKRHWAPTVSGVLPPTVTRDISSSSSDNAVFFAATGEPMLKSPSVSPTPALRSHRDFLVAPLPIISPTAPIKSKLKTDSPTLLSKPLLNRTSSASPVTFVPLSISPTNVAQVAPSPSTVKSPPPTTTLQSSPPTTHKFSPSAIISRQASNESSVGSPASPNGPLSPTDGHLVTMLSPMRKTGRVWDPARGVELFKRGSEEVLARFLKMGSWEEEGGNSHR
ncbi:hypothetical protein BYT27DRAFT_6590276 [Phlegmacium glaucopus]|nr:hypothetical protein BYT27DRAFT_6590276 [Phlegmacium glaucopus]